MAYCTAWRQSGCRRDCEVSTKEWPPMFVVLGHLGVSTSCCKLHNCLPNCVFHKQYFFPTFWHTLFATLSSGTATMQSKVTQRRVVKRSWVQWSTWCLQLKQVDLLSHSQPDNTTLNWLQQTGGRYKRAPSVHLTPSWSHGSGSCWPHESQWLKLGTFDNYR